MAHIFCRYEKAYCDIEKRRDEFGSAGPSLITPTGAITQEFPHPCDGYCQFQGKCEAGPGGDDDILNDAYDEDGNRRRCLYLCSRECEFERTVTSYDYRPYEGLKLRGIDIEYWDIIYLKIDDRVLVDTEAEKAKYENLTPKAGRYL